MQIGTRYRSIWAGTALLAAFTLSPVHAAPQSHEEAATGSTDAAASAADDVDADAASAGAAATNQAAASPNHALVTGGAAGTAKTASAPAAAQERDLGRAMRDVAKPVLEELAHSDVAEAVRALDVSKGDATVDAGLETARADDDRDPTARRRAWDGSGQRQAQENTVHSSANRDPERDKARASMLLRGLIDEIKPWALGAAVLYVLAYIAKFTLAARRRTVQRRLERRKYNRPRASQSSQQGRL